MWLARHSVGIRSRPLPSAPPPLIPLGLGSRRITHRFSLDRTRELVHASLIDQNRTYTPYWCTRESKRERESEREVVPRVRVEREKDVPRATPPILLPTALATPPPPFVERSGVRSTRRDPSPRRFDSSSTRASGLRKPRPPPCNRRLPSHFPVPPPPPSETHDFFLATFFVRREKHADST